MGNEMLQLADQYKELRDRKSELAAQMKALQAELDEAKDQLIQAMTDEEVDSFKRNGFMFSLVIKEYPGAVPETKEDLYAAMKQHGFEHLFTINPQTLAATVKELKSNNDDIMPDWLEGLIRTYEQASIRCARSRT